MSLGVGVAHGKTILFGEHAVVHGHPALAAGIERGVVVEVLEDASGPVMEVDPWQLEARPSGDRTVDLALRQFLAARDLGASPIRLRATSDVPLGAGLGSSAALFVAAARALGQMMGEETSCEKVAEWATVAEEVFHRNPSGVDVAATSKGGLGWFTRAEGWQPAALPRPLTLVIGREPGRRQTGQVVEMVGSRLREAPERVHGIFREIHQVATQAREAFATYDLPRIGALMNRNHSMLAELGVSSPGLDRLCSVALEAGSLGAKLTGAGGGGSVIALAPGREREVIQAWHAIGREAFTAEVRAS